MSEAVRYTRAGAIGIITLDRPDNRNSMTPELLDAFSVASKQAREDHDVRCVVITGTGSSFSAGADFKSQLQRANPDHAPSERSFAMYEPFLSVLDIPVPVIGALNGHAVGGGFGLALVCDLRVGSTEAKYGANFVRLGLAPGMAISYLLPRLVGVARASEMLYTGQLITGAEALALGFLNRAVEPLAVMSVALVLAESIAEGAPLAIRATKAAIRRGLDLHVKEAARAEAYAQAETVGTADAQEGIAALLEKRSPSFKGR